MLIDELFEQIGKFGRYHQLLYAVVFVAGIPNAFIVMVFVFSQYEPEFHCKLPEEIQNFTKQESNISREDVLNFSIPFEFDQKGNLRRSQCEMFARNYSDVDVNDILYFQSNLTQNVSLPKKMKCNDGWKYYLKGSELSAVTEFDMVCDSSWMAPLAISMNQVGMALGSFSGTLADRFGRRPIFLIACAMQVLFQAIGALSWDYYSYLVSLFFAGCANLVNYVVAFVVATETISVEWRNFIAISCFYAYAIGYCMTALLGYLFQNWRNYLWAASIVSTIMYLPTYWLFPESARWLIKKGRKEEAIVELKKMARMNGVKFNVDEFFENKLLDEDAATKKETSGILDTIRILFKSRIAGRTLVTFYVWFATGLSYFGISLFSKRFSENRFLNCFYGGLSELPALIVGYYGVRFIGRPRAAFILMCLCGFPNIILPFLGEDVSILTSIIAMIGKGSVSVVFYVAYFLSAETIPTLQRSSAMSLASVCARVGGFMAPFIMYIGKFQASVPNLVMGVTTIASGILVIFFVPETAGVPLPDTLEEAEQNKRFYGVRICRDLAPKKENPKKMTEQTLI